MLRKVFSKIISGLFCFYIEFVYKTSKINVTDAENKLSESSETFVICFWHGDSYCYYPLLRGRNACAVTTVNARGDYVERILRYFGYIPCRMPDSPEGGGHLFALRGAVNEGGAKNLVLTLDGPLGPYREPKQFALICAMTLRKRFLPIAVSVKRKINLSRRWDNYCLPLPFNELAFRVGSPIAINAKNVDETREKLKKALL